MQYLKFTYYDLSMSFGNGFGGVTFLRECFSLRNYMKAVLCFFTCDHPFSTYEKFSEKLTLLTP